MKPLSLAPDENAIELSRVVDRSLRDSKAVDLSGLVIEPGKKVWTVWVDISVLDYGGNVLDACTIAAVAALYDAKLPKVVRENDNIIIQKRRRSLHSQLSTLLLPFPWQR